MPRNLLLTLSFIFSLAFALCLGWVVPVFAANSALEPPVRHLQASELEQVISLDGQWQLQGPDGKVFLAAVPGPWERYYQPRLLTRMGQGVYRLHLQLPPEAQGQFFKLHSNLVGGEHFSCEVNGQMAGRNGLQPGTTSRVVQFFPFQATAPLLQISCQVQNTRLHNSGLIRSVYFGPAHLIEQLQLQGKMLGNLNIGVYLFLAMFHLVLFLGYRQDRALLWFAWLCLTLGLFGEFYHARNLEYFGLTIPVEVSAIATRLPLFMMLPAFFLYVKAMAPHPNKVSYLSPRFINGLLWFNLFFSLTVFAPTQWYTPSTLIWFVSMALAMCYNAWALRKFLPYRDSYLYLISNLLFSLAFVHDLLNGLGIFPNENISRYSMLLFCLAQAVFLSWRMQANYQRALRLQGELEEVNHNLDHLVSERTAEVQVQNEELQRLVKFKDEMTRMVVHDLKAPLQNLLQLPAPQQELDPQQRQSFQAAGQRLVLLVENMLTAQPAPVGLQVVTAPLALKPLVEQVMLSVQNWARGKKIQLQQQIGVDLWVQVDQHLLERVLLNLLDNALKQTPIGGEICFGAELRDNTVWFWLDDTGAGIPEPMRAQAFEQHQSFATGKAPRSSGLGLYFCRQVLLAHQGSIELLPLPVGTRVLMSLPLAAQGAAEADWRAEELLQLTPLLAALRQLEVYEVSDIQQLLQGLQSTAGSRLQRWLEALQQAVYHVDEETYVQILDQVPTAADC